MFKDLDDQIVGEAMVIHGKQLFIDDHLVGELQGARKVLNQPVKHPKNPLILRDRKSDGISVGYGAVVYDPADRLFKLWYNVTVVPEGVAYRDHQRHQSHTCYATSPDGIAWTKPVTDRETGANYIRFEPPEPWVGGAGVMIDPLARRPSAAFQDALCGETNRPSEFAVDPRRLFEGRDCLEAGAGQPGSPVQRHPSGAVLGRAGRTLCGLSAVRPSQHPEYQPDRKRRLHPLVAQGHGREALQARRAFFDLFLRHAGHAVRGNLHRSVEHLPRRDDPADPAGQVVDGPARRAIGLQPRRGHLAAGSQGGGDFHDRSSA